MISAYPINLLSECRAIILLYSIPHILPINLPKVLVVNFASKNDIEQELYCDVFGTPTREMEISQDFV